MTTKKTEVEAKPINSSKGLMIHAQYIKDLSFENPTAPYSLTNSGQASLDININITTNNIKLNEQNNQTKEVVLHITAKSHIDDNILFIIELQYAGLFSFDPEASEGEIETMSYVHCPHVLFPFARRIISDISTDSGFNPLILNLIDFNGLYLEQKNKSDN